MAAGVNAGKSSGADSRELYQNWIKGGLGLNIVKEGIIPFVTEEVQNQHSDFIKSFANSCTSCDLRNLQPDHTFQKAGNSKSCPLGMKKCLCLGKNQIPCPNNICGKLHDKIVNAHRSKDPNWSNTDITKWFNLKEYWEVAKCFINTGGYAGKKSAEETDCSGLLSIIINNTAFPFTISTTVQSLDTFSEMRQIRNYIMHSANLEIDNNDLKIYLEKMEILLGMISRLGRSSAHLNASAAAERIQKLKDAMTISSEDETSLREETLKQLKLEKDNALREIENKKQDITNIADKSAHEVNSEYMSAATELEKVKEQGITSLQTERDNILKAFDTESKSKQSEIEGTGQTFLDKIETQRETAVSTINDRKKEALQRLKETDNKTESRLESIETSLKSGQENVKRLHNRTGVIEEEHKNMKYEIAEIKKRVDEIDKATDIHKERLAYSSKKKDLRKELCQYYQDHFFHVPVTPAIKRQVGTIDHNFLEVTEIKPPAFLETLVQEKIRKYENRYGRWLVEPDLKEHCVLNGDSYKSVFINDKKTNVYQNIVLTGEEKSGKSTWCWNLLYRWVNACKRIICTDSMTLLPDQNEQNEREEHESDVREDESFLETFDIVIYIPLKNLPKYETVLDLIKHNAESPFFRKEERLTELVEILRSKHSKCLILLDDLQELNGDASIQNPVKETLENCYYVSTSLVKAWVAPDFKVEQFDRCISIRCVPNITMLPSADKFTGGEISKIKKSIEYKEQIDKCSRKDSAPFVACHKSFDFSELPVFIVFLILNWHSTGHIGKTRAMNHASTADFIIQLAESDMTGTLRKIENYDSYRHLWSDAKAKLPTCFEHLLKLTEYAGLILKLAKSTFQDQFGGVEKYDLSTDEEMLLYRMGMLVDKASNYEDVDQTYQILDCSFGAFLSALYLVVATQTTNDDRLLCVFEAYCETYDKLRQKEDILVFASGMDPKIVSSLSFRLYPCLKSSEETHTFFQNPFQKCTEEMLCFSKEFPSIEYPIYTTTSHVSGDYGRKIWGCNCDKITDVHLDADEIQNQDIYLLKKTKNVRAIKWSIPQANEEKYKLEEVTNIFPALPLLTVLALSGKGSGWTPCCKETQNLDLMSCINIQHLSLENISYRNIYINGTNLVSLCVDSIYKCAIKTEYAVLKREQGPLDNNVDIYERCKEPHFANDTSKLSESSAGDGQIDQTNLTESDNVTKGPEACLKEKERQQNRAEGSEERDKSENLGKLAVYTFTDRNGDNKSNTKERSETLLETVSPKLAHICCSRMNDCKLEVNGRQTNILSVILKDCKKSALVLKLPFQDASSQISKYTESRIKSIEIAQCSFTKFIYHAEHYPKSMETEAEVIVDSLEYERNEQSGFHSNISINIKEVKLRDLFDDMNTEDPHQSEFKDEIETPDIDLAVDIVDIPKLSNITLIESLAHMTGLKRLTCKNFAWSLWELFGNVLTRIKILEFLSIYNNRDLPVTLFQNIKQINHLTQLVVKGNCEGTHNERKISDKRKAGLKYLATCLKDLQNIEYVDILNLEIWPKQYLSSLERSAPDIHSISCALHSQKDIETLCSTLLNIPKLTSIDLVCNVDEDVEDILLCLVQQPKLKHFSCSGISFEDSFPEDASQFDLSHLQSFRVETTNSWSDIPYIIRFIPSMTSLTKLSIQAFLSETTWAVLASTLPQLFHLHTVELSSMARRIMPVAILESLTKVRSLRKLTLHFQFDAEKKISAAVSDLNQLEVLELVYQTLYDYADLSELLKELAKLINLQELAVIVHRYRKPKKYNELANSLPCLQNISRLALGHMVRTPSVLLSLKHMMNLRYLYLPGLDASEWFSLGQSLPYLSNLEYLETSVKEKPPPVQKYWKFYEETGALAFDESGEDDLTLFE